VCKKTSTPCWSVENYSLNDFFVCVSASLVNGYEGMDTFMRYLVIHLIHIIKTLLFYKLIKLTWNHKWMKSQSRMLVLFFFVNGWKNHKSMRNDYTSLTEEAIYIFQRSHFNSPTTASSEQKNEWNVIFIMI
jgi:hypothetical protein